MFKIVWWLGGSARDDRVKTRTEILTRGSFCCRGENRVRVRRIGLTHLGTCLKKLIPTQKCHNPTEEVLENDLSRPDREGVRLRVRWKSKKMMGYNYIENRFMAPALPKGITFHVPPTGTKKYTATFSSGGTIRRVSFGHRDYEHFRDAVPASLGGQRWKHKNHLDPARRKNYRQRHGALMCSDGRPCIAKRYSPAWFSYYFLW